MDIVIPTKENIAQAAALLSEGHLIGMPTETVYGLAADASNDMAVARIYEVKNRPSFNPLILHVSSIEQARIYAHLDERAETLAAHFWPGPLTMVLPLKANAGISKLLTAGLETIAIRCPAHPVALDLIEALHRPLAAPSANPSTRISPTKAEHVFHGFQGLMEPQMILDGGTCVVGLESTVLDLTTDQPVILRPGCFAQQDFAPFFDVETANDAAAIKAPGMLTKHYSPRHILRMNAKEVGEGEVLLAFGSQPLDGAKTVYNLSPEGDLTEAAANLFAMLHEIDQITCRGIAVMPIPETGVGIAINDRLTRAAAQ